MRKLGAYAKHRGYARRESPHVSQLSPYFRHRLCSVKEVTSCILDQASWEEGEAFLSQLAWRTYFKGHLEQHPSLWTAFLEGTRLRQASLDADKRELYENVCLGKSGIDYFDAWTRELVENGWLHNHVRMWYASIWVFTLRLPWELGADFFLRHLLDGDPAANTLSWRWVSGLHTKGKHYLAQPANIRRFASIDSVDSFPLATDAAPLPWDGGFPHQALPSVSSLRDLQFPSLSCCPAGLLVLPEDLSIEKSELSETPFSSVCVLSARDVHEQLRPSPKVTAFVEQAVVDAGERLCDHWGGKIIECRSEIYPMVGKASPSNVGRGDPMRIYSGWVHSLKDGILTWARNEHLKSIWMMRPPVGPYADALDALRDDLGLHGIRLFEFRRRWDSIHWPHAKRGYFPFREGYRERTESLLSM